MIISERIFYVMEQKKITQLELSRRTGIATSNISDWKKKKTNPKQEKELIGIIKIQIWIMKSLGRILRF